MNNFKNLYINLKVILFYRSRRCLNANGGINFKFYYCTTVKYEGEESAEHKYEENTHCYFHPSCTEETCSEITTSFHIKNNFLTTAEENQLYTEVNPYLQRKNYEFGHWDDAIHGYRETEQQKWSKDCSLILQRVREVVFPDNSDVLPHVHILDLAPDGVIKPHIDSVRFCGNTVSGLCLLSDAVMRLVHEQQSDQVVDILLPRFALYIMKDESRYKYTHEILARDVSYFGDKFIERGRRISVIFRNLPP